MLLLVGHIVLDSRGHVVFRRDHQTHFEALLRAFVNTFGFLGGNGGVASRAPPVVPSIFGPMTPNQFEFEKHDVFGALRVVALDLDFRRLSEIVLLLLEGNLGRRRGRVAPAAAAHVRFDLLYGLLGVDLRKAGLRDENVASSPEG